MNIILKLLEFYISLNLIIYGYSLYDIINLEFSHIKKFLKKISSSNESETSIILENSNFDDFLIGIFYSDNFEIIKKILLTYKIIIKVLF